MSSSCWWTGMCPPVRYNFRWNMTWRWLSQEGKHGWLNKYFGTWNGTTFESLKHLRNKPLVLQRSTTASWSGEPRILRTKPQQTIYILQRWLMTVCLLSTFSHFFIENWSASATQQQQFWHWCVELLLSPGHTVILQEWRWKNFRC